MHMNGGRRFVLSCWDRDGAGLQRHRKQAPAGPSNTQGPPTNPQNFSAVWLRRMRNDSLYSQACDVHMNGRRSFVLGAVLSIQNSSFIYPACHRCLSRLTRTASRFHCQKCDSTCEEAAHRYRMCMKIAEDQALHIVTVFGSCLENIFGASASSLHRILQRSELLPCSGEGASGQELLLQAAEDCLIGRSFIFATKVIDNLHNGTSALRSHMVACQMIPVHNDPTGNTILNRYYRLAESILSNSSFHSKSNLSTNATQRALLDLSASKSSTSLRKSGKRFSDYWQQSLGLISSAQATPCNPCHNQPEEDKEQSYEEQCKFQENEIFAQKPETLKDLQFASTAHPTIPRNGLLQGYKSPLSTHKPSTDTFRIRSQQCSLHFHGLKSQSPLPCWQHGYLQSISNSGSYRSKGCSACLEHFPSPNIQTNESHQVENGTWDEFPFSESLSEFIVRLENAEEARFRSGFQQAKFCLSNKKQEACEGPFRYTSEFIKTPEALLAKNKTLTDSTTQNNSGWGDMPYVTLEDASNNAPASIHSSSKEPFQQGSASGGLQVPLKNCFVRDFMVVDSCASADNAQNSQCEIFLHTKASYLIAENKKDLQIYGIANANKQEAFSKEAQDVYNELIRPNDDQQGSRCGTWDEFPFSKSLSEFIDRLDNEGETKSYSSSKKITFCSYSGKKKDCGRCSNNTSSSFKAPDTFVAQPIHKAKNKTPIVTKTPNGSEGDRVKITSMNDACKTLQFGISCSSEEPGDGSTLQNFQRPELTYRNVQCSTLNSSVCGVTKVKMPYISTEDKKGFQTSNCFPQATESIKDHQGSSSRAFEAKVDQIIEDGQYPLRSATFDNFPLFDKFVTKVENGHVSFTDTETDLSNNNEAGRNHSKSMLDYIKTPEVFLVRSCKKVKNEALTKNTDMGDRLDFKPITFNDYPGDIGSICISSKKPVGRSSRMLWRSSQKSFTSDFISPISDFMSVDLLANMASIWNPSQSAQHKTTLLENKNAPYVRAYKKGNEQTLSHVPKKKNWPIVSAGRDVASCFKEAKYVNRKRKLEDGHLHRARSNGLKSFLSYEIYNASDDLFDPDSSLEENGQPRSKKSVKRRYGTETQIFESSSLMGSPCLDVIVPHRCSNIQTSVDDCVEEMLEKNQQQNFKRSPKRWHGIKSFKTSPLLDLPRSCTIVPHRRSNIQIRYLQDDPKTAHTHIQSLLPCFQSTPVLRQLSESDFLFSAQASPVSSAARSRRSRNSLTEFLVRKMRRSLNRSSSAYFEKFFAYSPISASMLPTELLRSEITEQENTLACRLASQACSSRSSDGIGGKTRMLDRSREARHTTDQYEVETVCDSASVTPKISSVNLLPGDWSPELFQEKSDNFEQTDSVQRRLF